MKHLFWIDTSVLIENSHTLHPYERIPKFWVFLNEQIQSGVIRIPKIVHGEVVKGNDWCAKWCKTRSQGNFCVSPTRKIQEHHFRVVVDHVEIKYGEMNIRHQLDKFATGADPWVIAYARDCGEDGHVVSEEDRVRKNDQRIKIPNVCGDLGVKWCNTHEMLRILKAKF